MIACITVYQVKPWIKTSLAPGSGVVTKYLLQRYFIQFIEYRYSDIEDNVIALFLYIIKKIM